MIVITSDVAILTIAIDVLNRNLINPFRSYSKLRFSPKVQNRKIMTYRATQPFSRILRYIVLKIVNLTLAAKSPCAACACVREREKGRGGEGEGGREGGREEERKGE